MLSKVNTLLFKHYRANAATPINPRPEDLEVERAMAQLYFWLELGELSQLGSAQLANLEMQFWLASS